MSDRICDVAALARRIQTRAADQPRVVAAISGFGGSGKSTLSAQLGALLDATVIHVDDFIAADEHGAKENYLHDWDRLEQLTLARLKVDTEVVSRIYDWPTNRQILERSTLGKHVIVEGSAGLISDGYRRYFDLTVWIDVPAHIAHARGKMRDKVEQGVNHDDLWDNVWAPLELDQFAIQRPDLKADLLLRND
jgi:uridine kinase